MRQQFLGMTKFVVSMRERIDGKTRRSFRQRGASFHPLHAPKNRLHPKRIRPQFVGLLRVLTAPWPPLVIARGQWSTLVRA